MAVLIPPEERVEPLGPTPVLRDRPITPEDPTPSIGEVAGAAWRRSNLIGSALEAYSGVEVDDTPDPEFDAFAYVEGTEWEQDAPVFIMNARNRQQAEQVKVRLRREREDAKTLANAGIGGTVADLLISVADPTILIGGGAALRGATRLGTAARAARAGLVAGAGATAAQELGLQGTQIDRDVSESILNVLVGGVGGGVIGGAAGALLGRTARHGGPAALVSEVLEPEMLDGDAGLMVPTEGAGRSAGAAVPELGSNLPINHGGALWLQDKLRLNPVAGGQMSPLSTVRELTAQMAEATGFLERNVEGRVTTDQGAVETLTKIHYTRKAQADLDARSAYIEYYKDRKPTLGDQITGITTSRFMRGEKMSFSEFRREVGRAMRRDDGASHPVPQVAKAAAGYRKMIDQVTRDAQAVGLLSDDLKLIGAQKYLHRAYSQDLIRSHRGEFRRRIMAHFAKQRDARLRKKQEIRAQLQLVEAEMGADFIDAPETARNLREKAVRKASQKRREADALEAEYGGFSDEYFQQQAAAARADAEARIEAANVELDAAKGRKEVARATAKLRRAQGALARADEATADFLREKARQRAERARLRANEANAKAETAREVEAKAKADLAKARKEAAERIRAALTEADKEGIEDFAAGKIDTEEFLTGEDPLLDMSDAEVFGMADEVIEALTGSSRVMNPTLNIVQGPRGPAKARMLAVADEVLDGGRAIEYGKYKPTNAEEAKLSFLVDDIADVMDRYTRSMAPDIELARRFGKPDMLDQIAKINEEAGRRQAAVSGDPKEAARIERARERGVQIIEGFRDRLRGTFGMPQTSAGRLVRRGANVMKSASYLGMMGSVVLASIPDLAAPFHYGVRRAFGDGFIPLIKAMSVGDEAVAHMRAQAEMLRPGLELATNTRAMELANLNETFGRQSRAERWLEGATDRFNYLNLLSFWNEALKQITGMASIRWHVDTMEKLVAGTARDVEVARLARNNIDKATAEEILSLVKGGGGVRVDGKWYPSAERWEGARGKNLADTLIAAVNKDMDSFVVTPGLDRPMFMSNPVAGVLTQFMGFGISVLQRITTAALGRKDKEALAAFAVSFGLGLMAAWVREVSRGKSTEDWSEARWVYEALDNSGVYFGIFGNVMAFSDYQFGVGPSLVTGDKPSRFQSREALGSALGPAVNLVADWLNLFQAVTSENADMNRWNTTRTVRRSIPGNNLFYVRPLVNGLEDRVNEAVGFK